MYTDTCIQAFIFTACSYSIITQAPSVKVLQQQIRVSLKNLESLSYNVTEPAQLKEVLTLTTQLEQKVQNMAPMESGLLLRPSNTSSLLARKIKLKYKRTNQWRRAQAYSSLPKGCKSGRPKVLRLRRTKVRCMDACILLHHM